jgi:hypothetical protein
MPVDALRELLARHAPRVPSLVFLSTSTSVDVGRAFVDAGVPVVVAIRGLIPEEDVSRFAVALYRRLLGGTAPRAAFDAALAENEGAVSSGKQVRPAGEFCYLGADDAEGPTPPSTGELRDVTRRLCQCNLPLHVDQSAMPMNHDEGSGYEEDEEESDYRSAGGEGAGDKDGGRRRAAEAASHAGDSEEQKLAPLAYGDAFVGRHVEMHRLIESVTNNQLTCCHGPQGMGKSALMLETARYLRQRYFFPHGIFCCSLEGVRSMKQVRTRIAASLRLQVRSDDEMFKLMARRAPRMQRRGAVRARASRTAPAPSTPHTGTAAACSSSTGARLRSSSGRSSFGSSSSCCARRASTC